MDDIWHLRTILLQGHYTAEIIMDGTADDAADGDKSNGSKVDALDGFEEGRCYIFLIFIVAIMFNSLTSVGEPRYTNL